MDLDIIVEYRPSLHNPPRRSPLLLGPPSNNITLISGTNGFTISEWESIEKSPSIYEIVKSLISQGILRILSDRRIKTKEKENKSTLPEDTASAIGVIKNTFRLGLLEEWKKTDTRREIQRAIEVQIKESQESEIVEKTTKAKTKKDTSNKQTAED